jgi:hypothetical protein
VAQALGLPAKTGLNVVHMVLQQLPAEILTSMPQPAQTFARQIRELPATALASFKS